MGYEVIYIGSHLKELLYYQCLGGCLQVFDKFDNNLSTLPYLFVPYIHPVCIVKLFDMLGIYVFCLVQDPASAPSDPVERTAWTFGQKATIELTQ